MLLFDAEKYILYNLLNYENVSDTWFEGKQAWGIKESRCDNDNLSLKH